MRANELLFEIRQAFSQVAPDNNHLGTAAGRIAEIADTLETLGGDPANRDVILRARAILAEKGLDISQRVISRLEALSAEILSVAGADAVRAACAPIERIGTDRSGEKMESIPSEYVLPRGIPQNSRQSCGHDKKCHGGCSWGGACIFVSLKRFPRHASTAPDSRGCQSRGRVRVNSAVDGTRF